MRDEMKIRERASDDSMSDNEHKNILDTSRIRFTSVGDADVKTYRRMIHGLFIDKCQ